MCIHKLTAPSKILYRSLKQFYTVDLYGLCCYIKQYQPLQEDDNMMEQKLRQYRCCFTGHRPEKLDKPEAEVIEGLKKEIRTAIADGFQTFISGMARGVDLWAAEIVLAFRDEGTAIRLICANPYRGFESRWSWDWQERYWRIMEPADLVRFISPSYSRDCFQRRNEWMIDHSARVITAYNGQPGGTRNTLEYAKRCGVPLVVLK